MTLHPLAKVLKDRGITQEKLGMACNVAPDKISKFIHWKQYPYPKAKTAIAAYLKLPDYELFPSPNDLIDMIAILENENQMLRKELAQLKELIAQNRNQNPMLKDIKAATRNHAHFL